MAEKTENPEPGDLWLRQPGTLPGHYNMTLIERPAEELIEQAFIWEATDELVSWRRDAKDGPALYFLPREVFLRDFRLSRKAAERGLVSSTSGPSCKSACPSSSRSAATATG